jgi:hypothetical protein
MNIIYLAVFILFITSCANHSNHKLKQGDCLYFQDDTPQGKYIKDGAWKIVGISKEGKYLVRSFGGYFFNLAEKADLPKNGWSFIIENLSMDTAEKDGVIIECPKE